LNPARPLAGTRLCALDAIPDPGAKGFSFVSGDYLFHGFVLRSGGRLRGFIDRCPHAGLPLAMIEDRYLTREGDLILCSAHGALFRIEDGLCLAGPCAGLALAVWPVEAIGAEVFSA
jgi:nitrite reductase/ring-hydroxylating ferredoxin subunit